MIVAVACWAPPNAAYHQGRRLTGPSMTRGRSRSVPVGANTTYNVATMGNQNYALVANCSRRHVVSGDYLTMRCERVSESSVPFAFKCRGQRRHSQSERCGHAGNPGSGRSSTLRRCATLCAMDAALVHRLASGEGWGLLQSLPPYDAAQAMSLAIRLRGEGFAADLVAAALTQSELRARAAAKFGASAGDLLFTREGLEQATRAAIAQRHAARFVQAGVRHVYDLGCGIGADAMAFATAGLGVTAVDADETTAAVAAVNLRHWSNAQATHALAQEVQIPAVESSPGCGVWLDPARRLPGVADAHGRSRRLFRLADISPPWEAVRGYLNRTPAAGAKLSPAFPHSEIPLGMEAQWTSYEGEVLECALWAGATVQTPGRSAVVLRADHASLVTEHDAHDASPAPAELNRLGPYLYEPDRAVIRAGLVGALTNVAGGRELTPGVGYVTGHQEVQLPWARRYAVTDAMPFNVKALRALLRDRGTGNLTIKKRGVSLDADALRRQLRLTGEHETTIVITRVGGVQVTLVVTPF